MHEFDFIARYFAPLASSPAARGLRDDAALFSPASGCDLVLTQDTLIQGVHFIGSESPGEIARKALRVNLSDLAAKGAVPFGYLHSLSLPSPPDETWMSSYAAGLAEDQAQFGITLLGGDTTRTPGPLSITITALGSAPHGGSPARSGAKVGDELWASGTLGDGALGLLLLQNKITHHAGGDFLMERYRLPQPRLALGQALAPHVTAMMDISDGLVQDASHIAAASGVMCVIEHASIPLSEAARACLSRYPEHATLPLCGGDDYELLFTAEPGKRNIIANIAAQCDVPFTCIGHIAAGNSVRVLDSALVPITLEKQGFRHF